jgi:ribosomal protein S6
MKTDKNKTDQGNTEPIKELISKQKIQQKVLEKMIIEIEKKKKNQS